MPNSVGDKFEDTAMDQSELIAKLWKAITEPRVSALLSSLLTLSGKLIYDRWISGIGVSTETILSDLDKGNFLSAKRRKRLQHDADSSLALWGRELPPPADGPKLLSWPENERAIYVRSLSAFAEHSACPFSDTVNNSTHLFFKFEAADLRSALEDKFQEVETRYKHSKDLILHRKYSTKETPKVWILASNLCIRKREDAVEVLEDLVRTVRKRIPEAKVVLEVYLASDLRVQLSKYLINNGAEQKDADIDHVTLNNAARYTLARQKALDYL